MDAASSTFGWGFKRAATGAAPTGLSAAELVSEERNSHGPRLVRRALVGAVAARLVAQEAVTRALETVHLERLVQPLHLRLRRGNRRADARIVAGVQAEHRRMHGGDGRAVRRRPVIHDRGAVPLQRG